MKLHSRGTINKIDYTVIGISEKRAKNDPDGTWHETVLIDDHGHLAFLTHSTGHWVFLRQVEKPLTYTGMSVTCEGVELTRFLRYKPLVLTFTGEYPYDLTSSKNGSVTEYISPPFIFTEEKIMDGTEYFFGRYLRRRVISQEFADGGPLPEKEGIGVCQPFLYGTDSLKFVRLSMISVLFLGVLYFIAASFEQSEELLASGSLYTSGSPKTGTSVSRSFTIDRNTPLRFEAYSPVTNDWTEANVTLVNETTGEERSIDLNIEYYSGVDSDGPWSEGSRDSKAYMNFVEPGTYHIESVLSPLPTASRDLSFQVYRSSVSSWNFWICIMILAAGCLIIFYWQQAFEKSRKEWHQR